MRRAGQLLIAAAATLVAAGCGDGALWARYRAERDFWKACKEVDRIQLNPRLAPDAEYDRALAAFRRLAEEFPPERWGAGPRSAGYAGDVAEVSGMAALALGQVEEMRGRIDRAERCYASAFERYRGVSTVAAEAAAGQARSLLRLGREGEAAAVWMEMARDLPLVDEKRGLALEPALEAPLEAARALSGRGQAAAADSVLDAAVERYQRELASRSGTEAAPPIGMKLALALERRREFDRSLDAWRRVLREPALGADRPQVVLALARGALEAARPDTALVYTAWAGREFRGPLGAEARLIRARAWESLGMADSALVVYEGLVESEPPGSEAQAQARFRRGELLEKIGRWEEARAEYRGLAALQPAHELGLAALVRIVRHHADQKEGELARIEGRRALELVDQLIATQRDDGVLMRGRRARADLWLAMGEAGRACDALADLWRRYPEAPAGAEAGLEAAQLAESGLGDRKRAMELYQGLLAGSGEPATQRQAQAAIERLSRR